MKSLALGDARSAAAFGFFALAAASLLSPSSVSSQAPPVAAPTAAKTADGWEIAIAPRAGFFLPQRSESGVVPRRPTGGFEVMARRKGSWYGARALFERSASWSPRTDLAAQVLQGPDASLVGSEDPQAFFETVVLDAVAFAPGLDGARPYVFTGYGSKVIGATEEAGILPYSLVAAERAPAWHAGFGIEAPLGQGGAVVFELGDYYGRNGGPDAVHDMHITLMARLADVGGLVRKLGLNDEPDDQVHATGGSRSTRRVGRGRCGDLRVVLHRSARAFLDHAGAWLLEREAENNLVLGVAGLSARPAAGFRARRSGPLEPRWVTVERGTDIVGCAFRTPPYKMAISEMSPAAAACLARDVADAYVEMPAVLGPNETARAFAAEWSAIKGVRAVPGTRQRIHALTRRPSAVRRARGSVRLAGPADLPLVERWLTDFVRETRLDTASDIPSLARRLVGEANVAGGVGAAARTPPRLALWTVDDRPVSMAGFSSRTRNGVRIGYVRTPSRHRGRGYATSLVARMSAQVLDAGFTHCVLYTDLSNPTANHIYHAIGYRPIRDVMDVDFVST